MVVGGGRSEVADAGTLAARSEAPGIGAPCAAAALDCAESWDSAGSCAAAVTETNNAAANVYFQLRITLLSKYSQDQTFREIDFETGFLNLFSRFEGANDLAKFKT